MKTNSHHQSDELIHKELQELRNPVSSKRGLGSCIHTMQSPPVSKVWRAMGGTLSIGTAALLIVAAILLGMLTPTNAFAGELNKIENAQALQQMIHQKTHIYSGAQNPHLIMEFWIDHEKEAYRQYSGTNKLQIARANDGKYQYHYVAAELVGDGKPYASVTKDQSDHFSVGTVDSMLNSNYYRQWKIEKTEDVMLNGKICDLYKFANGTCLLWVNPLTNLPLQREIYDRDMTLWKRDFYDYPNAFDESIFEPVKVRGVTYMDLSTTSKRILGNPESAGDKK